MEDRTRILVIDNEPGILSLMQTFFTGRGYDCRVASSGPGGLSALDEFDSHVIFSDIDMPGMSGLELTRNILESRPHTAVILMTGNSDVALAIEALRLGAADYLLKPFDFNTAESSVRRALSKWQALRHKDEEIAALTQRLRETMNSTLTIGTKTMETFCRTMEMRDIETYSHVERVSNYACCLARKMGLDAKEIEDIRIGSLLHDVGKVMVPDRILLKKGPLTDREWTIMRKHVKVGYWIVSGIPGMESAAKIIVQHHEQYSGGGYPDGLKGNEICIGARIFTIADSYDAITSSRPYRERRSDEAARAEIAAFSGKQFDPHVVEVFSSIPKDEWRRIVPSNAIPIHEVVEA